MAILKNIGSYFGRRKAKVFSLFLLASLLAWLVSNLSGVYESRTAFEIDYENVPDTLLVSKKAKKQLFVKVRASGFRLFNYNLGPKRITLDISKAQRKNSRFFLTQNDLISAFENQLSNSVQVLDFNRDTLFLDVYQVVKKEVPIQVDINLKLEQNHILEGGVKINPDTVTIKGPKSELDEIKKIKTARINLDKVTSDFSVQANLVRPSKLENSELLVNSSTVSGKVMRFSEKVYQVNVDVENVPEGYSAKTFPNTVSILCKASVELLKTIEDDDFMLVADYNEVKTDNKVLLTLKKSPEGVYDTRLMENEVTLLLEEQ
ncbi:YbbR-like domain-containing protein [Allomuricauda sp. d1]|uniref:CdaR family protein n=1 Tax=Allomuricauda sp. d1 TaxID=3136725 RepID=UPI0031CF5EBA